MRSINFEEITEAVESLCIEAAYELPDDVLNVLQSAEEKENPRAAANQYLRAMKQLRNAYKKFQKDNPEVVEALTEGTYYIILKITDADIRKGYVMILR